MLNYTTSFRILGFHLDILQLMWVGVNRKSIDDYAVLEWKNLMKLHIFAAKHKVNIQWKTISLRWLCIDLELIPSEIMTSRETQEYIRAIEMETIIYEEAVINENNTKVIPNKECILLTHNL